MHTHPDALIHSHTHSQTHTHTYTHTQTRIHPDTHIRTHIYTHSHIHTHTLAHIHTTQTYSNTLISTYTYHTHIHTHPTESAISSSCRLLEAVTTGFKASRPPRCCRAATHGQDLITRALVLSSHSSFFFQGKSTDEHPLRGRLSPTWEAGAGASTPLPSHACWVSCAWGQPGFRICGFTVLT